ncbi:hypothetical protein ACQV2X_05495 [Facklamia sp. P12945]
MKERKVGDRYRPIVTIKKIKKGKATVIEVGGETFVWKPKDMYEARNND